MTDDLPFWKTKKLGEMTPAEWESLCDGCAKCCLHKLIDDDTEELHHTNVACRLLDMDACRCRLYETRTQHVGDCTVLRPDNLITLSWMPKTCAYRLLDRGKDLPDWHPLVCGDPDGPRKAGHSACSLELISETEAGPLQNYIIEEP